MRPFSKLFQIKELTDTKTVPCTKRENRHSNPRTFPTRTRTPETDVRTNQHPFFWKTVNSAILTRLEIDRRPSLQFIYDIFVFYSVLWIFYFKRDLPVWKFSIRKWNQALCIPVAKFRDIAYNRQAVPRLYLRHFNRKTYIPTYHMSMFCWLSADKQTF